MSELTDLSTGANRKMVRAQIQWAERPGAGQAAGFEAAIDAIAAQVKTQMDNYAARTGASVTTEKAAIDTLATAVKAGPIEPPAAA
jgi:hypothetical protein